MNDLFAAILVLLALGILSGLVRFWQHCRAVHPEAARKALHVGMGVITLSFPWLFESSLSVFLLALVAAGALFAVRIVPRLGTMKEVLHGVGRTSLGEIYFPFGVALLFFASDGEPVLYWPPLLLLTFADSLAALAGVAFGSRHYTTDDGQKTVEGSVAFFVTAFISTFLSVAVWSDLAWTNILLVSVLFGLIGVLLEAIAWRGLDNIFIPVAGFLFLDAFLVLDGLGLSWRVALLVALLVFTFLWKRRTTLNDSALLGSALYGYLALVVGGVLWAFPPLLLFLFYTRVVPYQPESRRNVQPAAGVLAVAAPGLFWLLLYRLYEDPVFLFPYSLAFAAHLGMIWIARWLEGGQSIAAPRVLLQAALSTGLIMILPIVVGAGDWKQWGFYFTVAVAGTAFGGWLSANHFASLQGEGSVVPPCWSFRGSLVFALSLGLHLAVGG